MSSTTPPPRWYDLDGNLHIIGKGDECCKILGRACGICGEFVHVSPVYGGLAEICEGHEYTHWNTSPVPYHDNVWLTDYRKPPCECHNEKG